MPPDVPPERPNILVIKLGAFGNIVLSLAAYAAIRQHHPTATITVLTTKPYANLLQTFPYFDKVLTDPRPGLWDLAALRRLGQMLTAENFARVYDLQTSKRSSRYFHLFPPKNRPEWSGIAFGCSLPDRDPDRNKRHDTERQQSQLRQAGIERFPPADLSWCQADIARFGLPDDFALLVPGSSPDRPNKRWPASRYQTLAEHLRRTGIAPVILGTPPEQPIGAEIPSAISLIGQTNFADIATLARSARFAVGNDTGPMHLIATAGCPAVTLFSNASNPAQCAPKGRWTKVLQRENLTDLPVRDVLESLPD